MIIWFSENMCDPISTNKFCATWAIKSPNVIVIGILQCVTIVSKSWIDNERRTMLDLLGMGMTTSSESNYISDELQNLLLSYRTRKTHMHDSSPFFNHIVVHKQWKNW